MLNKFLQDIRIKELQFFVKNMQAKAKVLEFGAGAGWQSKLLQNAGFDVQAIDLPTSNYKKIKEFPIIEYNGLIIPFENNTFDYVISSNVLEHIIDLDKSLQEIHRVLKPNGTTIHILPTSQWRILTSIMYYFHPLNVGYGLIKRFSLIAVRHGERGNTFSEVKLYSQKAWTEIFEKNNFRIEKYETNQLIYSGYMTFPFRFTFKLRKLLTKWLGSSCHVFVLKKA